MKTRQEAAAEVASYAVSFGTFYLLIFLARRSGASGWSGPLGRFARACVTGRQPDSTPDEHEPLQQGDSPTPQAPSALRRAVTLIVCALGIQAAYLCWGVMQETIMTSTYSSGERFSSSKFLVFANRIIALLVALPPLWWEGRHAAARRRAGAPRSAPLYRYSYCSVSNILSSAAQYEALHFVSFPTQVLAKACKMVPVMLMGYVVSGKRYTAWEYVVACGVTAGVVLFKLWETNDAPVKDTQAVGIALIVVYMVCDSFTSNWQSKIFKDHAPSSMMMMAVVNLFSSSFTLASLFLGGEVGYVLGFMARSPELIRHVVLMSICSAVGQLFIFHTIKQFGPLVFATIQTVRQFLSVVLSIVLFAHPVNPGMCFGILVVFVSLGAQIADKARQGPDCGANGHGRKMGADEPQRSERRRRGGTP